MDKSYYSVCKKSIITKKATFYENEKYFCEEEIELGIVIVSDEKILNKGLEGYWFFKDEFKLYFYSDKELRKEKLQNLQDI